MKNLKGFRLVFLGMLLYMPYLLWSLSHEDAPSWAFWISAIPAGLCILIGLLQSRSKKEPEFDDTMRETMRERKYMGKEENR